jgi:hypothetical protein
MLAKRVLGNALPPAGERGVYVRRLLLDRDVR